MAPNGIIIKPKQYCILRENHIIYKYDVSFYFKQKTKHPHTLIPTTVATAAFGSRWIHPHRVLRKTKCEDAPLQTPGNT